MTAISQSTEVTISPPIWGDHVGIRTVFYDASERLFQSLGLEEDWIAREMSILKGKFGGNFWKREIREARLLGARTLFLVARNADDMIVGFAEAKRNKEIAFLDSIYVAPAAQHMGIGGRLINNVYRFAGERPLQLRALEANSPAIDWYTRQGFTKLGDTVKLDRGRMAVTMQREGGV